MKIEGLIIHLTRAQSRRRQVDELLPSLPVPARILEAVDGQSLSAAELSAVYRRNLHEPHYPFELRAGEIACFLSHRKAWKEIVERDLDAALVLEDDVGIVPDVFDVAFKLAVAACDGEPAYIQFGLRPLKGRAETLTRDGDVRIVRPENVMLGTVGQLLTRKAAEMLLENTRMFDRPIDVFLQMHWLTGVRPIAAIPSGVVDRTNEIGGTTIHSSKTMVERLSREWGRFVYRQRVRWLSHLHRKDGMA